MPDFNKAVIEEFRSNDGNVVDNGGFGRSLVLLHSVGAKSGAERINPVAAIRVSDGWLVAASAAGAPNDPDWAHNLRAQPGVHIEYPGDDGIGTAEVTARELSGSERDSAWQRFVDRSSAFADYQVRAGGRVIPVFVLEPKD